MITSNCQICGTSVTCAGFTPRKFCSVDCKSEWQRQQKPVNREWLYQKYVVENLTANDIAKIVKRDPKRVWGWLRDYGIETRPRGSYTPVHFKAGEEGAFKGYRHTDKVKEKIRQSRIQDGHVPYLKNGVHHLKGKRGADTPNWKGGITPERQALYGSLEWKLAVKAVWKRDNAICQRCKLDHRTIKRGEVIFDIHHIVSFENKALRAEVSNLVLLCRPCHLWVHSRENKNKEYLAS
jgi:hypothetical protein